LGLNAHVDVWVAVVVSVAVLGLLLALSLAAWLLASLGRTVALAGDPLQALDWWSSRRRYNGRARRDWMDWVHR